MKTNRIYQIGLIFAVSVELKHKTYNYFSSKSQIRMRFGSNEPYLVKIKQKLWILASTSKETKPNKHPVYNGQDKYLMPVFFYFCGKEQFFKVQ